MSTPHEADGIPTEPTPTDVAALPTDANTAVVTQPPTPDVRGPQTGTQAVTTLLAGIRALEQAATPGPWFAENGNGAGFRTVYYTFHNGDTLDRDWIADSHGPDAAFIAAARTDVPRLVAALEAVDKLLEEKYKLWAAICGNTCGKDITGIDHDAIADEVAAAIRTAITTVLGGGE